MAAFFSARSTSGLSSVGGQNSLRKSGPPGCTSRPDGFGAGTLRVQVPLRQDDDEACPPDAQALGEAKSPHARCIRFEPITPALRPEKIRLHPSMQADWIKPAAGACSLGQDAALKIGNRSPRPTRAPTGSLKGKSS